MVDHRIEPSILALLLEGLLDEIRVTRMRRVPTRVRLKRKRYYRKKRARLKRLARIRRRKPKSKRLAKRRAAIKKRMHIKPGSRKRIRLTSWDRIPNLMEGLQVNNTSELIRGFENAVLLAESLLKLGPAKVEESFDEFNIPLPQMNRDTFDVDPMFESLLGVKKVQGYDNLNAIITDANRMIESVKGGETNEAHDVLLSMVEALDKASEQYLVESRYGLKWQELGNGDLEVFFQSEKDKEDFDAKDIYDAFEELTGNGYDFVDPEEVGALTDAPILGIVSHDDNGELTGIEKLWWYPNYAVTDPVAELKEKGKVVFTKAPDEKIESKNADRSGQDKRRVEKEKEGEKPSIKLDKDGKQIKEEEEPKKIKTLTPEEEAAFNVFWKKHPHLSWNVAMKKFFRGKKVMKEDEDDKFVTIYLKGGKFDAVAQMLLADKLEKLLGREVALVGTDAFNIYTQDPKLIERAKTVIGADNIAEIPSEQVPFDVAEAKEPVAKTAKEFFDRFNAYMEKHYGIYAADAGISLAEIEKEGTHKGISPEEFARETARDQDLDSKSDLGIFDDTNAYTIELTQGENVTPAEISSAAKLSGTKIQGMGGGSNKVLKVIAKDMKDVDQAADLIGRAKIKKIQKGVASLMTSKDEAIVESDPSLKPPKKWFNKMLKRASGDDKAAVVGSIWSKLSDKKKAEIRAREGKHYGPAESKTESKMKWHIEEHNGKFYVFTTDVHGNKYDTMHHFKTKQEAESFIANKNKTEAVGSGVEGGVMGGGEYPTGQQRAFNTIAAKGVTEAAQDFSQEFEMDPLFKAELEKLGYLGDVEVVQMTPEEKEEKGFKKDVEIVKLKDKTQKELQRTHTLFTSGETAEKSFSEAEEGLKEFILEKAKELFPEEKFEVETSHGFKDSYTGYDAAAIYATVKLGDEKVELEPDSLYMRDDGYITSGAAESWNWAYWLMYDNSPFVDSAFTEAYVEDDMARGLSEMVSYLDESGFKFDLEKTLKKMVADKSEVAKESVGEAVVEPAKTEKTEAEATDAKTPAPVEKKKKDPKITQRTVKIKVPLKDAAEALGYEGWTKMNDYLDADSMDDVHHSGYSAEDVKNFYLPKGIDDDIALLFPTQVAWAAEAAERDAYGAAIGEARREAVVNALEKITNVPCEYLGETKKGEEYSVSTTGGIKSAKLDMKNKKGPFVEVEIENPEHLINAIVSGVGRFQSEIPVDGKLTEKELIAQFHHIGDYFEVYGERKPSGDLDSQFTPNTDDSFFKSEIEFHMEQMNTLEIAEAVIEAVDAGRIEDENAAIALAAKIAKHPKKDIAKAVKDLHGKSVEKFKSRAASVKDEE